MVSKRVRVTNASGLHLRPTGILCNEAILFKSKITLVTERTNANAKSVLGVLAACVKCGDEVEFTCEGPDEDDALAAMVSLVESGLGEVPASGQEQKVSQ